MKVWTKKHTAVQADSSQGECSLEPWILLWKPITPQIHASYTILSKMQWTQMLLRNRRGLPVEQIKRDQCCLQELSGVFWNSSTLAASLFALSQLLSPWPLLFLNRHDHNKQAFLARGQPGSWRCICSFCFAIYTAVLKQCFPTSAGYSWALHPTCLQAACACLTCARCVLFALPAGVYSQAAERVQELLCWL